MERCINSKISKPFPQDSKVTREGKDLRLPLFPIGSFCFHDISVWDFTRSSSPSSWRAPNTTLYFTTWLGYRKCVSCLTCCVTRCRASWSPIWWQNPSPHLCREPRLCWLGRVCLTPSGRALPVSSAQPVWGHIYHFQTASGLFKCSGLLAFLLHFWKLFLMSKWTKFCFQSCS